MARASDGDAFFIGDGSVPSADVSPRGPAALALGHANHFHLVEPPKAPESGGESWIEMVPVTWSSPSEAMHDDSMVMAAGERETRARKATLRRKRSESDLTAAAAGDRRDAFERMVETDILEPLAEEVGRSLSLAHGGSREAALHRNVGLELEAVFGVSSMPQRRRSRSISDVGGAASLALVPACPEEHLSRLEEMMDVRTERFMLVVQAMMGENRVLRTEFERAQHDRYEITMRQMAMMNAMVESASERRALARRQDVTHGHVLTVARRVEPLVASRTARVLGEQDPLFSAIYRQLEACYMADLASNGGVPVCYDELDIGKAAIEGLFGVLPIPGGEAIGGVLFAAYQQHYLTVQKDKRRLRSKNLQSLDTAKESFARIAKELTQVYGGLSSYLSEDGLDDFGCMLAHHIMEALGANLVVSSHLMNMLKSHWGVDDDMGDGGAAVGGAGGGGAGSPLVPRYSPASLEEEPDATASSGPRNLLSGVGGGELSVSLLDDDAGVGTGVITTTSEDRSVIAREKPGERFARLLGEERLGWMREAGGAEEHKLAVARERQEIVERFCVAHACHVPWPRTWLGIRGGEGSVDASDVFNSLGLQTDHGRFTPVSASVRMVPGHLRHVPRGKFGSGWSGLLRKIAPGERFRSFRAATQAPSGEVRFGLAGATNLVFRRLHVDLEEIGGGAFRDPSTKLVYHKVD